MKRRKLADLFGVCAVLSVLITSCSGVAPTVPAAPYTTNVDEGTNPFNYDINDFMDTDTATLLFTIPSTSKAPDGTTLLSTIFQVINYDGGHTPRVQLVNGVDLNYEQFSEGATYVLHVEGTDTSDTATATISITINDLNDESPVFTELSPPLTENFDENQPVNTLVTTVAATDADAVDVTVSYSLTGAGTRYFSIDSTSGEIRTRSVLDFEAAVAPSYTPLVAIATDAAGNTGTLSIVITVDDVNDETPLCTPNTYFVSILETAADNSEVQEITPCTDADAGNTITYTISQDGSGRFDLDTSGPNPKILVEGGGAELDVDTASAPYNLDYELTVLARDDGNTHTATVTVFVSITGTNDHIPAWDTAPTDDNVDEDDPIGTLLQTVAASDDDKDQSGHSDGVVTYSIDDTSGKFAINAATGALRTAAELDAEAASSTYTFNVMATDGGTTITSSITVTVVDVNEFAPVFGQAVYHGSVAEAAAADTSIITLAVTDADLSPLSVTLAFTVVSGTPTTLFRFDGSNAMLIEVATPVEPDGAAGHDASYTLQVTATDAGGLVGTTTVVIDVTLADDTDPSLTAPSCSAVSETAAIGSTVCSAATCSDDDYGSTVSFSLTGDTDDNFEVNPQTGEIKLIKRPDFDVGGASVSVTLVCTESDGAGTDTEALTITVTDASDESPTCTVGQVVLERDETLAAGATVLAGGYCSDADAVDTTKEYSMTGDSVGAFTINPTTGEITVGASNTPIDSDVASPNNFFELTVTYTSGIGGATETIDIPVTIIINPVNEDTTVSCQAADTIAPDENLAVSSNVHTYTASDDDTAPHGVVSYEILAGPSTNPEYFNLDSSTGVVYLSKSLDRETHAQHILVIQATEGGGNTCSSSITINVGDINDNTPVCSPAAISFQLNEGSAHADFADANCMDNDDTAAHNTITYSLSQTPAGSEFSVDNMGVVDCSNALDYETSTSYTVEVTASDGTLSTVVTFTVQVGAVNDGSPVFGAYTSPANIDEDHTVGNIVVDMSVGMADPDGTTHAHGGPRYSITAGNTDDTFVIDATTGEIFLAKALQRDGTGGVTSYTLTVRASEIGDTGTTDAMVVINIADVNDETPSCTLESFVSSMNDGTTGAPTTIATLGCTDTDSTPATLTYTMTVPASATMFSVTSAGVLQLNSGQTLDYETATSHSFVITVSDTVHTITVRGALNVDPVDEGTPAFTGTPFMASWNENTVKTTPIITITATDTADSTDTLIYSFTTPPANFIIGATSGEIFLVGTLDHEATQTITFDVHVEDSDGNSPADATVTITVGDLNDNTPVFNPSQYTTTVAEGTTTGAPAVVTVTATDADNPTNIAANTNGDFTYAIASGSGGVFTIDPSSGAITLQATLDYESATSYTMPVTATDGGALVGTAVVIVSVGPRNDFAPTCDATTSSNNYVVSIDEDEAVGYNVQLVQSSDADDGDDGEVYFTMASSSIFSLNSQTGQITLISSLNYEALAVHSLTVTALDRGTTPAQSSIACTVTVNVNDINDVTPSCAPNTFNKVYREDITMAASQADPIANLDSDCDDVETGVNGDLSYSIVSVNGVAGSGPFDISAAGLVHVSAVGLDYETDTFHTIMIDIEDAGTNPEALTSTVTCYVTVTDVNEHDPAFTGQPTTDSIPETTATGTLVNQIVATDADTEDSISYAFSVTSNVFYIDSSTGEIYLIGALDAGATPSYMLTVVATDDGTVDMSRSNNHVITITILDVNNDSPLFNPTYYIFDVDEDATAGTTIGSVAATDDDGVTYSLVTTGTPFSVIAANGDITVQTPSAIEYDGAGATTLYQLVVRASDGTTTTDVGVVVTVNNINDAAPVFSPSAVYNEDVDEDEAIGFSVITVTATDADGTGTPEGTVTFEVESGDGGAFTVDATTGEVYTTALLDRETTATYTLIITATDAGTAPIHVVSGTVSLTIQDVNDNTPTCNPAAFITDIDEGATATMPVFTGLAAACSDADDGANAVITYDFVAGGCCDDFDINSGTGAIEVGTGVTLDYETTPSYVLPVTLTSGALVYTATVFVTINPTNDNTPTISPTFDTDDVDENVAIGTIVHDVPTATDGDDGPDGDLIYSIHSSTPANPFSIDPSTGEIKTTTNIDYETHQQYMVVVHVTDQGVPAQSVVYTLTLDVNDLNDNAPECTSSLYTELDYPEDSATTAAVNSDISCSDQDSAANTNLAYSITNGQPAGASAPFAMDATTGAITVNNMNQLDAETTATYTLTVEVTDQDAHPTALTSTITVVIELMDVNDEMPVFNPNTYTFTVMEDDAIGTVAGTVTAADDDISAAFNAITYTLTDTYFDVNLYDGRVFTKASLDADTMPSHSLTVTASDGTNSNTQAVTVNVGDVNDNAPSCVTTLHRSVAEDAALTDQVVDGADFSCTDTEDADVDFAMTAGDFSIDAATGDITVTATLDFETTQSYSLVVEAVDQTAPIQTTTIQVFITITSVNEAPPIIDVGIPATIGINETQAVPYTVRTITATDADSELTSDGVVRFSITNGNADNLFVIDENSGELILVKPLNAENAISHTLTIRASDKLDGDADSRNDDDVLTIDVTDENDNAPVFNPAVYSTIISEAAAAGALVLEVTSSDDDATAANQGQTLTIISGNTGNAFVESGVEIHVANPSILNYETTQVYELMVQMADAGGLTDDALVLIHISSNNDEAPVFNIASDSGSTSISEDTPVGDTLITFLATDDDDGAYGEVTYYITALNGGTDDYSFILDETSGTLSVGRLLDFDTAPTTYILTVEARDNNGATGDHMLDSTTYTITLEDTNDNTPQFTMNRYTHSISEDTAASTSVFQVVASDADSGLNAAITFSIIGGDGTADFEIDPTTGEISTTAAASLDYDSSQKEYTLIVQAVDGAVAPRTATSIVEISLIDVNDNDPDWRADDYTVSVAEDDAGGNVGATVTTFFCEDIDSNDNARMTLTKLTGVTSDPNNKFTLIAGNDQGVADGRLQIDAYLDREEFTSHVVEIEAEDHGATRRSSTMTLTIQVADVNDNDPVFTDAQNTPFFGYEVSIAEDVPLRTEVIDLDATDEDIDDNARLTFSIDSGNDLGHFTIDPDFGQIYTLSALNREAQTNYEILVAVADNGAVPRSLTCTVSILITDVNEFSPAFDNSDREVHITENELTGTQLTVVTATDSDLNHAVTITLDATSDANAAHFTLNQNTATTAVITTTLSLDRESVASYRLLVEAEDDGSPSRISTATLTVIVDDLNDNQPTWLAGSYNVTVFEDLAVGADVISTRATDADEGVNAELVYAIESGDGGRFSIDSSTGDITLQRALDRESTDFYGIVLTVADSGVTVDDTVSVSLSVTVQDINDNAPIFTDTFSFTVAENVANGTDVGQVVANDPDIGANGLIHFYIHDVREGNTGQFDIDILTGVVTTTTSALDREAVDRYIIRIRAEDLGTPVMTSYTDITVVISDVNDNTPYFEQTRYTASLTENSGYGVELFEVAAADPDLNDNADLSYSIPDFPENLYFTINETNRMLTTIASIDREVYPYIFFYIYATDMGNTALIGRASVNITVEDLNDNFPLLQKYFYDLNSATTEAKNFVIESIMAADADVGENGRISFSLEEDSSNFAVDEFTGDFTKSSSNELTGGSKYFFTVIVEDHGGPPKSTQGNIRLDIFDPNFYALQIHMKMLVEELYENEQDFLTKVEDLLRVDFPDCRCKLWKAKSVEVSGTSNTQRRRLLQSANNETIAYVIAISNADQIVSNSGSDVEKIYIHVDALLQYLSNGDNEPAQGFSNVAFEDYEVTEVGPYEPEESTPWYKTTVGLTVILTCTIVGVILLVCLIAVIVWLCLRTKERPVQAVLVKPAPQPKQTNTSLMGAPAAWNDPNNEIYNDPDSWKVQSRERNSADLKQEDALNNKRVDNGQVYDGKAYDPITGREYEFNTKTGERRWMTTSAASNRAGRLATPD